MPDTSKCDQVTADCPVEDTIYGYSPNLTASITLTALFSICCVIQLLQMLKWRLWSFGVAMILGAFSEAVGYIGRILLHANPYSSTGFEIQICTLTMAPAFWSAAIYLTLKHEVRLLGSQFSPLNLKPERYPYIFVTCDLISLALQGAGGGIAATADAAHVRAVGSDVMLAGMVWQVGTLTVFVGMTGQFFLRVWRASERGSLGADAREVWKGRRFWVFCCGVGVAFGATYVRCVYRIAEMAGGWRNPIMQDEVGFIVFESVMCAVAVITLSIAHPGSFFNQMCDTRTRTVKSGEDTETMLRQYS